MLKIKAKMNEIFNIYQNPTTSIIYEIAKQFDLTQLGFSTYSSYDTDELKSFYFSYFENSGEKYLSQEFLQLAMKFYGEDVTYDTFLNWLWAYQTANANYPNRQYTYPYDVLQSANKRMATIIINRFSKNWISIYNAYITEYEPLENYSMVEQENVNAKNTQTNSNKGFNSSDFVETTKSVNESDSTDNQRDLTRSGNIGVTTSQQMLQSEIELRKFDLWKRIFYDIDSIYCMKAI